MPPTEFVLAGRGRGLTKTGNPAYIAGSKLLAGANDSLRVYEPPSLSRIGTVDVEPPRPQVTRASTWLMTTRLKGNSAWIDLESQEFKPFLGFRPACSTNNNLYPANDVMNIPSLTAGCTCIDSPTAIACVPAAAVNRGGDE